MIGITLKRMPHKAAAGLLTAALMAVAGTAVVSAQTKLQARLALRPLTRGDIAAYKLPSTLQVSPGLKTVAIGEPLYLEAQVDTSIPASDIVSVTWSLTSKPSGSTALIADSPLGADVPVYEPSEREVSRVAGRGLLVADVPGPYIVTTTVSARDGSSSTAGQTIVAGTYVGIQACAACHSGGLAAVKTPSWSKTLHAEIFKDGMNGVASDHYGSGCLPCHTVGYNPANTAPTGGFDKVAAQIKWTFPTVLTAGTFDKLPDALKNVGNIQCENCHGPGSQHVKHGGDTMEISVAENTGACSQCHDAPTHHIKSAEWNNSMHAVTTRDPSGAGREGCVGCHTGAGFVAKANGIPAFETDYSPINCQACHEAHGQTTPTTNAHLVRTQKEVTLADGTVVNDAGSGALCMNCHQSRQNATTYAATAAASARFGPHHGPQADMLEGTNGFTYGKFIPSSAHAFAAKDTCVDCHMQTVSDTDPALSHVGGHTFTLSWTDPKTKVKKELVGACQQCHGPELGTFNFQLLDYNGDGVIEGVQTEVQRMLDQLSAMLPPVGKAKDALTIDATWTRPQLEAAYNWQMVKNDGSLGIHNMAYTVGLLKASMADLSGKK